METLETLETCDLGNTITKSRIIPSKYWCFTFNNYSKEDLETLETNFKSLNIKYIIGEEIGENGTPHLQGYIESDKKIRPLETFKNFKKIHWEKRKGTYEDNINYCSKDNKYITNFIIKRPLKDPLKNLDLYPWQIELLNILKEEPEERFIYWFWEPTGNIGKTSFCKSYIINNPNSSLILSGKSSDIKFGISEFIKNPKNDLKTAFFHYVRSQEDFISYEAIESVKDGIFYSGKFESSMCVFNIPHIIIFANFPPDETKLSLDRWIIKRL